LVFTFLKLWNHNVLDEWVLVLDKIIHAVPLYLTIFNYSQKIGDAIFEFINTYQDPYIAARMIGFAADLLKDQIKGPLLEKVRGYCSIQDEEVRRVLASEVLPKVC
jgi:hypothetical protein